MLWVFIVVVTILGYMANNIIKPKNYPPGPRWYPFFGCNNIIHSRISKYGSQWKVISEMAKEYNTDVLGLKMGHQNVVVVFGEKNIRQVSNDKEFDARPDDFFLRLRSFGQRVGITFVDGPLWREHRMFTLKQIRSKGFGKPSMDQDIHEGLQIILSYLDKSNGDPVNVRALVSMVVMNIIWKYIAGEYIKEQDLLKFIYLINERTKISTMAGGWLNQWPWLRFVAPEWCGYTSIQRMNEQMAEIINKSIKKHLDKSVKGHDFMYAFLEEMYNQKPSYTLDQLRGICLDFLIAGSQTVGSTFDFAVISAIRNRGYQEKVYDEIKNILGDQIPSWEDSSRLVYTCAFLEEVQRYFTVAPFSGPRRTLSDVVIDGYSVPKGTTVLVSLGDLHKDSRLWDAPNNFNPENFISDSRFPKKSNHSYPFGIGRRQCLGLALAKPFLFIAFVVILQKYSIESCNGNLPSDEPIIGLLSAPRHFTARFVKRKL